MFLEEVEYEYGNDVWGNEVSIFLDCLEDVGIVIEEWNGKEECD